MAENLPISGNCPCCGKPCDNMALLKKRDYVKILKVLNSIDYIPRPGERAIVQMQKFRNLLAKRITGWKGLYNEYK